MGGEPIPSASTTAQAASKAKDKDVVVDNSKDADDETVQSLPANAEDRKAAAALNSLNANEMSQENGETEESKQPSAADQEALGKAMSRLEIAAGGGKKKEEKKGDATKKEAEVKKKIKINAEDVTFLVDELDLTKNKATELLRAHDGDAITAIKAFIAPVVSSSA